jgi:hypothetical protein
MMLGLRPPSAAERAGAETPHRVTAKRRVRWITALGAQARRIKLVAAEAAEKSSNAVKLESFLGESSGSPTHATLFSRRSRELHWAMNTSDDLEVLES